MASSPHENETSSTSIIVNNKTNHNEQSQGSNYQTNNFYECQVIKCEKVENVTHQVQQIQTVVQGERKSAAESISDETRRVSRQVEKEAKRFWKKL